MDNKSHRFLNKNDCLPWPLLGYCTNVFGVSLATMNPTAGRTRVKCQTAPESCTFCVLPGSLAFHIYPDCSCMSQPRQGSSKIIVFHTMVPVMEAFSAAIPPFFQGLECHVASVGSHKHSSFIPTSLLLPSTLCPPSVEAENTNTEEIKPRKQCCVTPTISYCCLGLLDYHVFPASSAQVCSIQG